VLTNQPQEAISYHSKNLIGEERRIANKQDFSAGELAKIIESVMLASLAVTAADPSGLIGTIKDAFADVSSLLDAKAPAEAAAFKAWLHGISKKVAEAAKDGGFLGCGGVQVSDAEKATIDEVGRALKITA
jgi:hypothetical protein